MHTNILILIWIFISGNTFYLFLAPDFEEVDANAFNAMVGNVDLESDNQAGLAQEVLEAMLLGAPTTTPDIPTRTRDPDLTQGSLKKFKFRALFYFMLCFDKFFFFLLKSIHNNSCNYNNNRGWYTHI